MCRVAASSVPAALAGRTGVGLRLPHLAEVAATRPDAPWLEVHPENFLANAHATELLLELRAAYPVSVHTVGVSIGSVDGLDRTHLARLRAFIDAVDPVLVSGHLAWSTHDGDYLNDLLPLPYTEEALAVAAAHVRQVEDALGRPYVVENPSSYVGFQASAMAETDFLAALVDRTGCGLLCDVSNVVLSAHNMGYDPYAYLDRLPAHAVMEFHLGGFTAEHEDDGGMLLVDTHGTHVAESAWELFGHAVRRFGPRPTIIEWDNDLPPLATLLEQAARGDAVLARGRRVEGIP